MRDSNLAIYYEHPDWFRPLFAELDRRGVPYARLDATRHLYDPGEKEESYAVVFNRMSPSAYLRGHGHGIFYTLQYLSLIHISEPTRLLSISYAVFCLKKKK